MLDLTNEQRVFLANNFENANEMLAADSVNAILLPLDALITYKGFDDNYALNRWGTEAQRMYDEIYSQNEV